MVMVLARGDTISEATLKKVEEEKNVIEDKVWKFEAPLGVSKDKFKKKGEELSTKVDEWKTEKKKLEEYLRVEWPPAEGKAYELKAMKTRAKLFGKIEPLKLDLFEMG